MAINGQNGQGQSQAIVRGPAQRLDTLKKAFESSKASIAAVLPRHITPDRLIRIVTSACSRTPELLDCDPRSVVLATAQAAALGLEPNTPLGLSYLVPFKKQAQFIPGYRGLIRLAIQSGEVQSIQARTVHERDICEIEYGTNQRLVHTPYMGSDGAGDAIAFYAVAELKNGSKLFEFMTRAEIDALRRRSKASNDGPWVTDYDEMAKKTVIRRLCKTLPLSEEKLARSLEHQARAESGDGPDFSDVAVIDVPAEEPSQPGVPADRGEALAAKLAAGGSAS